MASPGAPIAKPLSVKRGNSGALKRRPPAGRIVVLDPGSGRTEEPVSGCEPVALAIGVAPTCPPGSAMSAAGVDDQLSIHGVRDLTLEGAQRFLGRLAFGHLAIEVLPPFARVADLADGDHMDGVVEASVAPGVEPVSHSRTARGFDGSRGVIR